MKRQIKFVDLNNIIHKSVDEQDKYLVTYDDDQEEFDRHQITYLEVKEKGAQCYYIYKHYLVHIKALLYNIDIRLVHKSKGEDVDITKEIKKIIFAHNDQKLYEFKCGDKLPVYEDNPFYSNYYDTNAIIVIFDCELEFFNRQIEFVITYQAKHVKGFTKLSRDYIFESNDSQSITISDKDKDLEPDSNIMCEKYRNIIILPEVNEYQSDPEYTLNSYYNKFRSKYKNIFYIRLDDGAKYVHSIRYVDEILDIEINGMECNGLPILFNGEISIIIQGMYENEDIIFNKKYEGVDTIIIDKTIVSVKKILENPFHEMVDIKIESDIDIIKIVFHENRNMELMNY